MKKNRSSAGRISSAVAVAAASLLALAGCTAAETEETGSVTVVSGKNGAAVTAALAESEVGAEYGVTWQNSWLGDGSLTITTLVSGAADLAFSGTTTVMDAVTQGNDLVIIAANNVAQAGVITLEVLPDSGIESLADLRGKTVSFASFPSANSVRVQSAMIDAGLEDVWDSLTIVTIPVGDAPAALEQGEADAVMVAAGPLQQVKSSLGSVTLVDFGADAYANQVEGVWVTTRSYADANADTVLALQCTIQAATAELIADPDLQVSTYAQLLGLTDEAAAAATQEKLTSSLDVTKLQEIADMYYETGNITEPFDFSAIVLDAPTTCSTVTE